MILQHTTGLDNHADSKDGNGEDTATQGSRGDAPAQGKAVVTCMLYMRPDLIT
jgi:hypothetical protein